MDYEMLRKYQRELRRLLDRARTQGVAIVAESEHGRVRLVPRDQLGALSLDGCGLTVRVDCNEPDAKRRSA